MHGHPRDRMAFKNSTHEPVWKSKQHQPPHTEGATYDHDVIWTRNLLIWSQTRYRCATRSDAVSCRIPGNVSSHFLSRTSHGRHLLLLVYGIWERAFFVQRTKQKLIAYPAWFTPPRTSRGFSLIKWQFSPHCVSVTLGQLVPESHLTDWKAYENSPVLDNRWHYFHNCLLAIPIPWWYKAFADLR